MPVHLYAYGRRVDVSRNFQGTGALISLNDKENHVNITKEYDLFVIDDTNIFGNSWSGRVVIRFMAVTLWKWCQNFFVF